MICSFIMQSKLTIDESIVRQAIVLFKESKHILLANMSAIGSGSVMTDYLGSD